MTTSEPSPADPADRLHARFGRRFEAGEIVYREGEPGTEAYLLEEGQVRLIKRVRGLERSLMVLRPGDLFGESALLVGAPRSSTAITVTPCLALALEQATMQSLLEKNPAIAVRVVRQLIVRLRDAEDRIEIMMLSDTRSKVVSALLKLAANASAARSGAASVAISPMELSSRVGLDVDTIKRAVQELRESQYVRVTDERIEIPDVEALRKLYGLLGVKAQIRGDEG
jgi:CRP-like cAMP-binding protein